jgi:hypothetical protein
MTPTHLHILLDFWRHNGSSGSRCAGKSNHFGRRGSRSRLRPRRWGTYCHRGGGTSISNLRSIFCTKSASSAKYLRFRSTGRTLWFLLSSRLRGHFFPLSVQSKACASTHQMLVLPTSHLERDKIAIPAGHFQRLGIVCKLPPPPQSPLSNWRPFKECETHKSGPFPTL